MEHEGLVPSELISLINTRKLYDVVKFSVDIDLFSMTDRAVAVEELARETGTDPRFMECLLNVLALAGYVAPAPSAEGRSFINTPVAQAYLDRKSKYFIGEDIFNDADTYEVLYDHFYGCPQGNNITKGFWTPEFVKTIGSRSLLGLVQATVDSIDLSGRARMLDLGGGHGLYSIFFTRKYPRLEAWVLDLPAVADVAKGNVDKLKADRVHVIACDFDRYEAKEGYDVVFASNFAGSPEGLDNMVTRAGDMLVDGGWLILRNYASDARDDVWSALVAMDRYARRGEQGLDSVELVAAIKRNGFRCVEELYRGDGFLIVKGVKK